MRKTRKCDELRRLATFEAILTSRSTEHNKTICVAKVHVRNSKTTTDVTRSML